ncbi:MAG: mechanosensitive ion channel family protein [Gemmatimonadales bacterium]|jgi:miniconductance mechanosensitive channel
MFIHATRLSSGIIPPAWSGARAVQDSGAASSGAAESTGDLLQQILASPPTLESALYFAGVLVASWIALVITRRVLLRIVRRITEQTKATWDDRLRDNRFFRNLSSVAPFLVTYYGITLVPDIVPALETLVQRVALAALIIMLVVAMNSFLAAVNAIYMAEYENARSRPIKGYLQIVSIVLWIGAVVTVLSLLMGRSPVFLLSGLGALMAVLLLVFRTTILSLVASVQIATNDMVRVGDWISMPQFGADGEVIDIALHTVKVQNWDKTITTIPTYKLVEDSFKNWRGMSEAGGRRIKRALNIDLNTIRFLAADEIERLGRFELLADYMAEKREALATYRGMRPDRPEGLEPTTRHLTNVGTFRVYMLNFLRARPDVHEGMTMLVRQLAPGPDGLPLEVYCFSKDTTWAVYEGLQADLFDHFIAVAPEFGLRVFQQPAGSDFAALTGRPVPSGDRPTATGS